MCFLIDTDDLYFYSLADREDFRRVVDTAPCHIGNVQEAINTAEINECTVIGDVLDNTLDNLTFFKVLYDFRTLFGTAFFKNCTA